MSASSIINSINKLTKEISELDKSFAVEIKKEADIYKLINNINRSITKNTSLSTHQSKQRQIQNHKNELAKINCKKADIHKKLADRNGKLVDLKIKLQKE